ncbi:MAG: efflux RND transporter periplasmic adaptor subunit [Patescibacteria group bacterium]|nr:efflux RND transporter periplasmic adaptor subunit [Patescibacteria group bacterium]
MKKLFKSKILWSVVLILIIGGVFAYRYFNKPKTVEYVTEDVRRGNLTQTIDATGKVKSATEIDLNFKNAGRLATVNVKVGDQIKEGQILAQIKATDLKINVNKAQANLNEALANLAKVETGATKQDIAVYQAAVEKASSDLDSAQSDLSNITETYTQAVVNQRQNILVDINSTLTKANISLQTLYDTIYYKGDANNLVTSNQSLYQQTVNGYSLSINKLDDAELSYNIAKLNPTDDKISDAIAKSLTALGQVSQTLNDGGALLDYVIITSSLTQANLDSLKLNINSERVTTNTSLNTIETGKQALNDASITLQTKVDSAKNAVTAAEKNLAKANADLSLKSAPARPEDLTLYQAQVARAHGDLQLALDQYSDTIIKAPIDGVITEVNFSVGEQTNLSQPAIVMLANEAFEIEVNVPESDIVKITRGDNAEITLDAFTDADIFDGVITTIDPAQTEIQDVIYYKVTVGFRPEQPAKVKNLVERIKPGMTANLTVKTGEINDILIIPARAVKEENGQKYVEILANGTPQRINITIGLRGDDGLVEVTSGLSEGQKVITFVRNQG